MMECPFHVGDEVVCTNLDMPSDAVWNAKFQRPVIGAAYRVRAVFEVPGFWFYRVQFPIFVRLQEITCPYGGAGEESGFPWQWFRKVEKPKQESSIEIFREIDRKVFEKAPVRA